MTEEISRLLRDVKDVLVVDQPYLDARIEDGKVIVEGVYVLARRVKEHQDLGSLARHKVRITIEVDYPKTEPVVRVLDSSIPHSPDFHCGKDGACCITVFELWVAKTPDPSIAEYFSTPLRNYFLSQYIRRVHGYWPFGEWSHDKKGLLEAMASSLMIKPELPRVRNILRWRSENLDGFVEMNMKCPCGLPSIASECCGREIQAFAASFDVQTAKRWLKALNGSGRTTSYRDIQAKCPSSNDLEQAA